MSVAIITAGGIGDVLMALQCATAIKKYEGLGIDLYVNSHQEILDFVTKCTNFRGLPCPPRSSIFKDPENPLNLHPIFLDKLFKQYKFVYSCVPDFLGQAPFSFPWFRYFKSYKSFMSQKVDLSVGGQAAMGIKDSTKNIFIHATSVTLEKNYALPKLQKLINLLNDTNYNVIICRTSKWKDVPLPFMLQGKYFDLVDQTIDVVARTIDSSDYFLGIDSGMAHIAYHLGVPRTILQYQFNQPFHIVRYQQDVTDNIPLESEPEQVFNRMVLNLKDPLTQALPAFFNIPQGISTKQLLYKKYYD